MGLPACSCHEKIVDHEKTQFPKSLCKRIGVGHRDKGIATNHNKSLQLVRNALKANPLSGPLSAFSRVCPQPSRLHT
jgi:hypothetical protein